MDDADLEKHVRYLRELSTKDDEVVKLVSGKKKRAPKSKKPVMTGDLRSLLMGS